MMMNLSLTQRSTVTWLLIAAAPFCLVWLHAPVLTLFLIGPVLACALHPAVKRLAGYRERRVLAVLVSRAQASYLASPVYQA